MNRLYFNKRKQWIYKVHTGDEATFRIIFQAVLTMTYSPLVVGEIEEHLEVSNYIVGTYVYKTLLKCLPAKEKNLEYETSLGTNIPIRLKVQNKSDVRCEFVCKVILFVSV